MLMSGKFQSQKSDLSHHSWSFLVRRPFLHQETLDSLLYALDLLNYPESPGLLYNICRGRIWGPSGNNRLINPYDPRDYDALYSLSGVEVDSLYKATHHVFASIITPPGYEYEAIQLSSATVLSIIPDNFK